MAISATAATFLSIALDVALAEIIERMEGMSEQEMIEDIPKLRDKKRQLVDKVRARSRE